jgi:hypothetical protein
MDVLVYRGAGTDVWGSAIFPMRRVRRFFVGGGLNRAADVQAGVGCGGWMTDLAARRTVRGRRGQGGLLEKGGEMRCMRFGILWE